jgi:hypothetical protein
MPDRMKAIAAAFVNAVKLDFGPTWSLREGDAPASDVDLQVT